MLRAYDYECPRGHKFELFLNEYVEKTVCGEKHTLTALYKGKPVIKEIVCGMEATHVWSFHYSSSHAQRFNPVVVHRDAQGNLRFPGNANSLVPAGYEKVELTTVQQVRDLEHRMNAKDKIAADKFRSARQSLTDGQLKENRRVMDTLVSQFSPKGKAFYAAMRRASEAKQQLGPKHTNPEFVVDAFSNNQSNRDQYFDESMAHGSHRGRR